MLQAKQNQNHWTTGEQAATAGQYTKHVVADVIANIGDVLSNHVGARLRGDKKFVLSL